MDQGAERWAERVLPGEQNFIGKDAIEGRTADGELTGGAKLVAAIEVEDVLDVLANDGVEGQVGRPRGGMNAGTRIEQRGILGLGSVGQGEIGGLDEAIGGFEERHFEDTGELANVARPVVLQEAGEGAGSKDDRTQLVAVAEAIEQELCERSDIFAALAERRDGEADRGEAEGEIGKERALAGHVAKRSLRGSDDDSAAGRAVLKGFEDAEKQSLARRGEQVNAIEVHEANECRGIRVGGEPLSRIAALEAGADKGRMAEQVARQGLLAAPVLALDGCDLQMGRGHFNLHKELAPCRADADDVDGRGSRIHIDERKARSRGKRLELS